MHLQADLTVCSPFPDLFEGLVSDIAKRGNAFARHAADIHVAIEVNQTMRPWRVTRMRIVIAKRVSSGASQTDLRVGPTERERIFIRNDEPESQRAVRDLRGNLAVEDRDILFPHGEDLAAMVIHRDQIDPIRAETVCQIRQRFQGLIIGAADNRVDADRQFALVFVTPEQLDSLQGCLETALHPSDLLVHFSDRRVNGNIHPAQPALDQALGFSLVDQCPVGRHRDFDPERRGLLDQLRDLRAEHWLSPGNMNFLCACFGEFVQYFFESIGGNGRLARVPPVIAHFTFEVAAVKDFDFDIKRLEWARMQYRFSKLVFFGLDLFGVIHLPRFSSVNLSLRNSNLQ